MDIVRSEALTKSYSLDKINQQEILKGISLNIKKGEFVALMGPSGSGKSTLLYNLSGMERASSGRVFFDNTELKKLNEKELANIRLNRMGFIFQQIHLLKNLSIFENIVISAYLSKKNSRHISNKKARVLMDKMDIAELANRNIAQLSGGQLQRAAICRALINDPEIIFGDEPTGALNSKSASEIIGILTYVNQKGTTILLATHDVKVAARTNRVIYLLDGKIVAEYCVEQPDQHAADPIKIREKALTNWLIAQGF